MGGSDQWGNMVNGVELGRRTAQAELYAVTAPLITTSDGKKMGKSAAGAVWLNADRLPPYDYWQFWRNTADADVGRFLKLFTELPLEEIAQLEKVSLLYTTHCTVLHTLHSVVVVCELREVQRL
jgi:tyrosyl-tRNA synthetase